MTSPIAHPAVPVETIGEVLALTNTMPPHEVPHWTAAAMAKAVGVSISSVQRIWKAVSGTVRTRTAARRSAIGV